MALQIGHRISIDFDLFSSSEITKDFLNNVEKIFTDKKVNILVNNPEELTILVDNIKVTFLAYPFPVILNLAKYKEVALLSIKEIAASKAYTIGRRGSYKDYVDLYFIISEKYSSLDDIIKIAERKYGSEFNSRLFLEQLVYLEDVKDVNIMFLKDEVIKNDLERFFENLVKKIKL